MTININNSKLLFIYKLSFFKIFTFKTTNKELKKYVEILNTKRRKDRIKLIYEEAIKIINKYYDKDLCQFKNDQCIVQRNNKSKTINGCCRTCPILTSKGCPTQNISCKLLYCKTALNNLKSLKLRDIKVLNLLSLTQRLILKTEFYSTKEQIINDLYYGILIYPFRAFYRELKKNSK